MKKDSSKDAIGYHMICKLDTCGSETIFAADRPCNIPFTKKVVITAEQVFLEL